MSDEARVSESLITSSMRTYVKRKERAAMRCGLGDAAALCDAIARDLLAENGLSRGQSTKLGQQLATIAKRCGDAIWAMREKVTILPDSEP